MAHTWPNVTDAAERARLARKARRWRRIDRSTDTPLARVLGIRAAMRFWVDSKPRFPYR